MEEKTREVIDLTRRLGKAVEVDCLSSVSRLKAHAIALPFSGSSAVLDASRTSLLIMTLHAP